MPIENYSENNLGYSLRVTNIGNYWLFNLRATQEESGVGEVGGGSSPPPNSGEKIFFAQTSCNIRAVDIFWKKEEQAPFIFDSILFFISCVREI